MNLTDLPEKYQNFHSLDIFGAGEYASVYKLTEDNNTFAVKTYPSELAAHVEAAVLDAWRKVGVNTPEFYEVGYQTDEDTWISIMEFIEATKIADLPTTEINSHFTQLATILAKMHSVPTTGWGKLNKNLTGMADKLTKGLGKYNEIAVDGSKELGIYSEEIKQNYQRAFSVIKDSEADLTPVICHFDFFIHDHLLTDKNEIYIIDPNALAAPREFELANLILNFKVDDRFDDKTIKSFMKTYRKEIKSMDIELNIEIVAAWFIMFTTYKRQKWLKIEKKSGAQKALTIISSGYTELLSNISELLV